jgi:SAM-dependent methyltransferase
MTDMRQPQAWDARYRQGTDRWELGMAAPPLQSFLKQHPLAPRPKGTVLVPGCGRGHEAALLARLGFDVVGLDFSVEAIREARRLQADLFDAGALDRAGLGANSLSGVVEHTCFCAIDPSQRDRYRSTVDRLLEPGGWLLGVFFCHDRPGGPPYGSDAEQLAASWSQIGFTGLIWEPAQGSVAQRSDEWLGLWRKPIQAESEAIPAGSR